MIIRLKLKIVQTNWRRYMIWCQNILNFRCKVSQHIDTTKGSSLCSLAESEALLNRVCIQFVFCSYFHLSIDNPTTFFSLEEKTMPLKWSPSSTAKRIEIRRKRLENKKKSRKVRRKLIHLTLNATGGRCRTKLEPL